MVIALEVLGSVNEYSIYLAPNADEKRKSILKRNTKNAQRHRQLCHGSSD
jgi:hypothetical protein